MRFIPAFIVLTTFSTLTFAAEPATEAAKNPHAAMPAAATPALPHQGKVVSTVDASIYTYVEVSDGDKTQWLAGPAVKVKKGDNIRYSEGTVMSNFYSKTLDRTFPTILFVNSIVPAP